MGVFRVQSPCGLMADLPGIFENALSALVNTSARGSVSTYTLPIFRGLPM